MISKAKALNADYRHLVWPLMVEQLFMILIGNVNVLIFSYYSDQVVAAIGLAEQVIVIGTMFMGIVGLGSTILFLQNAADDRLAYFQGVARQTLMLNLALGLIIIIITSLWGPVIMGWMQTPWEIRPLSVSYLRVIACSLIFQALSGAVSAILRSYGLAKMAMRLSVAYTLLTISGNLLVIFLPLANLQQRILAIGLMTIVSRAIGAGISLKFLQQHLPQVWQGLWDHFRFNRQISQQILVLGIPSGMENVSYNFSQTIITALISSLGTIQVSARIYCQTITAVVFALAVAVGQASQVVIGRLHRQDKIPELIQFGWQNTLLAMVGGMGINLLIALMGSQLLMIFTDDPQIIQIGQILLWLNVLYDPGRVGNEVMIANLNVMGQVRYPVILAILVTYLFTVPAVFLITRMSTFGLPAIWGIFIIDEVFRLSLFVRRWRQADWLN